MQKPCVVEKESIKKIEPEVLKKQAYTYLKIFVANFCVRIDFDVSVGAVFFGAESFEEEFAGWHLLWGDSVGKETLVVVTVTHQKFSADSNLEYK